MNKPLDLDQGYSPGSEKEWLSQLSKGKASEAPELLAKLTHQTLDGIDIAPLYTKSTVTHSQPGSFPYRRATRLQSQIDRQSDGWDIRQIYRQNDPVAVNRNLLHELERGVTSVHLVLQQDDSGVGVRMNSPDDVKAVLKGVYPELITISLQAGAATSSTATLLCNYLEGLELPDLQVKLAINADPISDRFADSVTSARGRSDFAASMEPGLDNLSALAKQFASRYPLSSSVGVNTAIWHDAGASDAQEIAAALSTALLYLRAMTKSGLEIDAAASQILFRFALDADFFCGIAKIRAARECWAHLCKHCGTSDDAGQMRIHAVTSTRMHSTVDTAVNQLRNTVSCVAGALAGADAISVEPHASQVGSSRLDEAPPIVDPDQHARRIARNIQLVLQEESQLHRVADPLGGSGAIEHMTDELVRVAWQLFREIEAEGGLTASIEKNAFTARVATTRDKREQLIRTRRLPLVGVSVYAPDPKLSNAAHGTTATEEPILAKVEAADRSSVSFEQLQAAARRWHNPAGSENPAVFLATIGEATDYQGRKSFVKNLLSAGGLATADETAEGTDSAECARAFANSLCSIAILCSSDSLYREHAVNLFDDLKKAGAQYVAIATHPDTVKKFDSDNRFDDCLYLHCDAIEKLSSLHAVLGITPIPDSNASADARPGAAK